jgi:hypothetical protein
MKIKLDENLGTKTAELLRDAGHDVNTVPEQNLCSSSDKELIEICCSERRCLVTLDLDFANPLVFKPEDYFGIAVLRLPSKAYPQDLYDTAKALIGGLELEGIEGKLWIIEKGRIREYQPSEDH